MRIDSYPLSPHSQEAEDQFPSKLDVETDAGHLAEQFLADNPSPTQDDIDNAITEAESILFSAAEFQDMSAEIDLSKENLTKAVEALHLIRRDENFVRIMEKPNSIQRRAIIEESFKGNEAEAMQVVNNTKRSGGKLDKLRRGSRQAFQRAYFNGATLEEVEKACEENDDTEGRTYWRPEVQAQCRIFKQFEEDHKGKKITDQQYEEWAISLIQRRRYLEKAGFLPKND